MITNYIETSDKPSATNEYSKHKYGQYFTPDIVADFMISLADISQEASILEPSCGEGVFLKLLKEKGFKKVTAYEIDPQLALTYDCVKYESFVSASISEKFDLIIGNPPYIRWKNLEQPLKDELAGNILWNKYFNSLCDYLYIFILKSIQLLEDNGQLIFICPEYWMNTTHAISLRNFMVNHGYFEEIYHFNETPVFNNATVSVVVFKYIKSQNKKPEIDIIKYYKNRALTIEALDKLKKKFGNDIESFKVKQFEVNQRWLLTSQDEAQMIAQFEKSCRSKNDLVQNLFGTTNSESYDTIGDICDIGNGMVSGLDKAFQLKDQVISEKEKEKTISVIKAKSLVPYTFQKITPYIFINDIEAEQDLMENYPLFYQQLVEHKEKLEKRYQYNREIPYWQWVFLRNYNLFNSNKPRIFVPCKERISNKDYFRFSYVKSGIFPTQDVTAIFLKDQVKESIYYLLAFLNNHRVFNWLKNKGIVKGNIVEFSEKPISSIPFKRIDWNNKTEVKLHNQISELTEGYVQDQNDLLLDEVERLFDKLLN